jgi:hypothetical protein
MVEHHSSSYLCLLNFFGFCSNPSGSEATADTEMGNQVSVTTVTTLGDLGHGATYRVTPLSVPSRTTGTL